MGVMTTKDWENRAKPKETPDIETTDSQIKERGTMKKINVLQMPSAPMGRANVSVFIGLNEDKTPKSVQFELVDKQLYLDKLLDSNGDLLTEATKVALMGKLMEQGFEEVSYYEDSGEIVKEIPIVNKSWKLGHPDNTPTEKINGNFGIRVIDQNGEPEEINLEIKDGAITTDRPEVASALYALQFYDIDVGAEVEDLTKDPEPADTEVVVDEDYKTSDGGIGEGPNMTPEEAELHDINDLSNEELLKHAEELNIDNAGGMTREELIDAVEGALQAEFVAETKRIKLEYMNNEELLKYAMELGIEGADSIEPAEVDRDSLIEVVREAVKNTDDSAFDVPQ